MRFGVYAYRIELLEFTDGTQLGPGDLTVICGPNNVGKSRLLKEIALFSTV
jgi:ABC-type cobalamin/Fe3+-siderophores transport system ATPase subunit